MQFEKLWRYDRLDLKTETLKTFSLRLRMNLLQISGTSFYLFCL